MSYQTLIDLFLTGAYRDGKSRSHSKLGPGRMPLRRTEGAKRLQAAQRGGSYAGKGYITYAEKDRICRRVIESKISVANRKDAREQIEQHRIDQRTA